MIVGEVINSRYDIKMLIGDGGMANVYLAYDRILREKVAIKMLRYELSKDASFIKRFNREAIQVTKLNHPNIVESYAVGEYNEQPFIVMEYIRGRTLKDYLRDVDFLSEEKILHIMTQICQGVDQAHQQGIIHRDLKSQNIMIDDELNVKITDFGIALSSNEADMTQTNTIMGSVHYLAPELARGSLATPSSDIYALGILLYELLIGSVPFKGESAVNIAIQHMENEIPSVRLTFTDLSDNYDHIIKKATAKKPSGRYLSVLELIEDLRVAHIEGGVLGMSHETPEATMILTPIKNHPQKEDIIPKKRRKRSLLSLINATLYTILITIATIVYFIVVILPGQFETPHARIPDTTGMTVQEARDTLDEAGFANAEISIREVINTAVPEGLVFRSNPAVGVQVRILDEQIIGIYIATHSVEAPTTDNTDDLNDEED